MHQGLLQGAFDSCLSNYGEHAYMPISSSATLSYIRSLIGSVFIVITIVVIIILLIIIVFFFLPLLSLLFIIIIIYYYYYYYFNLTSYIGREWLTNVKNVVKVSRVTFIKILQV